MVCETGNLFDADLPEPCFRVPFQVVPSANDLTSMRSNPYALGGFVKKWRRRGRTRCVEVARERGWEIGLHKYQPPRGRADYFDALKTVFFDEPVFCVLRVWRPTNAAYDVHNPFIKPILDGFVDVRLMSDDSYAHLPDVWFHFESVDESLKLTDDGRAARADLRKKGKKVPPLPARFWFDFFRLSRIGGNPLELVFANARAGE